MARAFFLVKLIFFIGLNSFTQNLSYKFKNFSTKEGLSQSSVIAIHQDKIGQMWFGTRDGLNKYDGTNFTTYRNITKDSLSISNNDILSITQDKEGFIWVGTYNGLNRYSPTNNNFTRFLRSSNNSSLNSNTIWCLQEVGSEIWVGTTNGLSIYDKLKGVFIDVLFLEKESVNLKNKFITKILKTRNGVIWVGTSKGLFKLINRDKNSFCFRPCSKDSLNNVIVQDLLEGDNGNVWVATQKNGMFLYEERTDSLIKLNKEFASTDFRALSTDKKGDLWLGTNNGIYIINSKGGLQYLEEENLSKVKSIYSDKNGSVWIGTYYGGLSLWDENNLNFNKINDKEGKDKLTYKVVSSIVKDSKGNIYVGTEGGGITVFDKNKKRINAINKELPVGNIKSLLVINNHYLLIGTFANGISVFDLVSRKIIKNYFPIGLLEIIQESSIYSIKKESENVLWIGTFGKGLIRFSKNDNSFKVFKNDTNSSKSLTSNRVRAILVDSKKRLWVGTQKGLNLISLNNTKSLFEVNRFFFNTKINSGDDILTIFEDENGSIWVGTKARGLFKFNGESFDNVAVNNSDNKTEIKSIHSILEDEKGNLWLSSNHGIASFNQEKKKTIIYNQTDGLIGNEFNDNSALKIDRSELYFGSPSGISYFNSNKIHVNTYNPQVVLTDFKIENKSVNIDKNGILKKHISYTESISLSHDNANFSINFSIPNFINSNNNLYSYRLIGIQDKWLTTSNNEAAYTLQKPGTYLFEVKGANNNEIWNDYSTKLKIIVKPAPWRSWWAFTIYFLLIITSLILLLRFLKSKTKLKHELELEHIESIRIEELNSAKLRFFTNISHEFRTPLTLILGPLQQILADYDGSSKMYKKLLIVENSANHLLQLINRLMNFRKLEDNHSKLESAQGNIVKFLKEIFYSFTEYAKNGGYKYQFNTNYEEINVYYDRTKMESVFFNLISNAFRYTPKGGGISINVKKETETLIIEVEDNGVGIPENHLDKIFDRFFEIPKKSSSQDIYKKGTGIGLSIAKNIVKLHKGHIEVENKVEGGVVFRVSLKLGRLHFSDDEILSDFKVSDDISQYESQLNKFDIGFDDTLDDLKINENKLVVLIVEDHKPLRLFIKNLLKKEYNVIEAENGEVAMKKALEHTPSLIISDVVMPVMTGTELCAKIKGNLKTSHIPFVLLTSRSSLMYRLEGLETGADEYISKPFNVKEFKLKVKNILEFNVRLKKKFSKDDYLTPDELTLSSLDEKLLKKAFNLVEENISNSEFNIPSFYSELGVSRTVLFAKIKAWANVTPNEFIQLIRMKRAAQLLENNKFKVSEICYKVGFKNPRYFSKCFQKRYKLTPSEYRNKFFDKNI